MKNILFIPTLIIFNFLFFSSNSFALQCGETIQTSITLTQDLNCPNTTDFALNIIGDNISVNGNGHAIYAPLAIAGIFVHGLSPNISGFVITGIQTGTGIFVYDSPGVSLHQNQSTNNMYGIRIYADTTSMNTVTIASNTLSNNSVFGIYVSHSFQGSIGHPVIIANDLSQSGSFALFVEADEFEVTMAGANSLFESTSGIYLKGGNFLIHDISLLDESIRHVGIFVDSAKSLGVSNLDVSTSLTPLPSEEQIGLDIYRTPSFVITQFTANGNDVGLKLETEAQVNTTGTVNCSHLSNNQAAGIMFSSYDSTIYGSVALNGVIFTETDPSKNVLISNGTIANPTFGPGFSCTVK